MGPRQPTRRQIIDWLGAAAEQAEQAEIYHAAAANPQALDAGLARQAARDAAAMQLIELAGCAEGFTRDRGEPGTTLARLDDVLRTLFKTRVAHVHPEIGIAPPAPLMPTNLSLMMGHLKAAVRNLDPETFKIQARDQQQALKSIYDGLTRIEKDGLPDPAALRPRDLHYAGYYHEIQFGRLAKATGLYENWNSPDPRRVDVNRSIFDADDMAHKFHAMRAGADKSRLPVSVVSPEHRDRVPGRSLSELMRELRHEYQRPDERLEELAKLSAVRAREEYRDSVRVLAQQYVRMTGDAKTAAAIHDYVQRQKPPLDREMIDAMRQALQTAADPGGDYLELPEAVRNQCIDLCLALDRQGDVRLLDILDAADGRDRSRGKETEAMIRSLSGAMPMSQESIESHLELSDAGLVRLEADFLKATTPAEQDQAAPETEFSVESIRDDPWTAVYLQIPAGADQALLKEAHYTVVQCCQAVFRPPNPFDIYAPDNDYTRDQNFDNSVRRLDELGDRLQAAQEHPEPLTVEITQSAGAQDQEAAAAPGQNIKARLAEEILAQQNNSQASYVIRPWEGGYAVFRTWNPDDEIVAQIDLPAPQQKLGAVQTLGELHAAIIDGSVFTAAPAWVTDEQMNKAQNSQALTLDDLAQRVQRILDDPTHEADEHDLEVLHALEERRAADIEATQASSTAAENELLEPTDGGDERQDRSRAEPVAETVEDVASSQEQPDDDQVRYDTETGELIEDAGRDITGRSHSGGRGQSP
jgi:hypothetical protein